MRTYRKIFGMMGLALAWFGVGCSAVSQTTSASPNVTAGQPTTAQTESCTTNINHCSLYECFGGDGSTARRLTPPEHISFCFQDLRCVEEAAKKKYLVAHIACNLVIVIPDPPPAQPTTSPPPIWQPETGDDLSE